MKRILPIVLATGLLAVIAVSCSTKKNTWTSRKYHTLTSRFNVNFNAKESFKEATKKVEAIYPETFDDLLPVFSFSYANAPNEASSDLNRVITKSNKLIALHSITAKPKNKGTTPEERKFYNQKEFNEMVDDAYLLIGKARMYMHLNEEATQVFEHILATYSGQNTIYETQLWLAFTSIEAGMDEQAENLLGKLAKAQEKDKEFPHKLTSQIEAMWAHYYIKKHQYENAIPRLTKALSKTTVYTTRIRYNFLLAQLNERIGNNNTATSYYNKVAKMNVPYEVSFSAKMRIANTMDNPFQRKELEKLYLKMLREKKNREFSDQLYFALGNLSKSQGDSLQAEVYYRKSIAAYDGNNTQKGLSALAIAKLMLANDQFINAYKYADTASEKLTNHIGFQEAYLLSSKLRTVATNLSVIQLEDSLQLIAKLSPEERDRYAGQLAAAASAKEQAEKQVSLTQQMSTYQNNQQAGGQSAQKGQGSQWYFYNTALLNKGAADFRMQWGQRKLEDNWRGKNKIVTRVDDEDPESEFILADSDSTATKGPAIADIKSPEYYLQNVPLTDEEFAASNKKIERALYAAANAFLKDLNNSEEATKTFTELLTRFPHTQELPSVYYNMYNIYMKQDNIASANVYKEKLSTEFPTDRLTLSILNPNYLTELSIKEAKAEQVYEQALQEFRNGNNPATLAIVNEAMEQFKDTDVEANFALLKVLATSYDGNFEAYKQALNAVAKTHSGTDVAQTALELIKTAEKEELRLVTESGWQAKSDTDNSSEPILGESGSESSSSYAYIKNEEHSLLLLFSKKVDINQSLFDIAVFNAENYLNKNYNIEEEKELDPNNNAATIQLFKNKDDVMIYYSDLLARCKLFTNLPAGSYLCVPISVSNLETLRKEKSIAGYMSFFKKHYAGNEPEANEE